MDRMTAQRTDSGDPAIVADGLFGLMYSELHRLARREVYRQGPLGGLGATTLLHEAYLKMSGSEGAVFGGHAQFMAYAARVMRRLIIDDVRRRRSQKRGGLFHITRLGTSHGDLLADPRTLSRIGDLLDELAQIEPELAEIIELKFFCGLSFAEIAALRGVSERTIQRSWEKGRLYLHHAISNERPTHILAHAAAQS